MKAAVWTEPNTVRLQDVPAPTRPARGEALVATQVAAVCATDYHILSGELPFYRPPIIVGHEAAGVVTKVGPGVKGLKPGVRVALEPTYGCGTCFVCNEGLPYLCPKDCQFVGGTRPGAMAEAFGAPARNLHPVPDKLSAVAACLVEPLGCCIHGLDRAGETKGKDVLITGAGFSGALFVQLLRPSARRIVVSGTRDIRLAMCRRYGADGLIDVRKQNLVPSARRYFGARGPDLIIECSGANGIMTPLVELLARQGTILIYSYIPHPQTVSIAALNLKEAIMQNSTSCADCIPRAIKLAAAGKVDLENLVTHRFTLDQAQEAYRVARDEKDTCFKAIVALED